MSVLSDLLFEFRKKGDSLVKLIFLNIIIFIVFNIAAEIIMLSGKWPEDPLFPWLALPSNLHTLPYKCWTIVTYMFYHKSLWHLVFNMLWLYWTGSIMQEYLNYKRLAGTYLAGGLCGALMYLAVARIGGINGYLLGASAGVMAVIVSAAAYLPNYSIRLLLLGEIRLKYIALAAFILTSIIDLGSNTGGKVAHIGGALYGLIYISLLKKGKDPSAGIYNLISSIFNFRKRSKLRVVHNSTKNNEEGKLSTNEQKKKVDEILDKISKSGYESLTKNEKEFLFKMSDKNKR